MLQRQVDVAADLPALSHRRKHVLGDRGGIEIQQADPLEAVDPVQLAKQARKRATLTAVDSVERRVLRDEEQLLDPAVGQIARFADDRGRVPAAKLSAQRRDDAERAGVVAAFGDLDVGVVRRRREDTRGGGIVQIGWRLMPGSRCVPASSTTC